MSDETRKDYSDDDRKKMASSGAAMPDGSFPISDEQDLKNAIHLAGNASDPDAARAHIKKRAASLGLTSLIPDTWDSENSADPPRDSLIRALMDGGVALSPASDGARDGRLGTLHGHFAVFNQQTRIDSAFEGRFLEQIEPGAFAKTFAENRDGMRVLFQHGKDPQIGNKPLGPIETLQEDEHGARYEVPLLDTSYNRDLVPGLEQGLYGASFRFRVLREKLDRKQARSESNPDGLPVRTLKEVGVKEFGPVTFGAYDGATAGVRSMTDEFIFSDMIRDPERLKRLVDYQPRHEDDTECSRCGYEHDRSVSCSEAEALASLGEDAPRQRAATSVAPASRRRGQTDYLYGDQKRRLPSWRL